MYIAVNSNDDLESNKLYLYRYNSSELFNGTNRTFVPINNIDISSNNQYQSFSHARGN
jgi:hypothetical protein